MSNSWMESFASSLRSWRSLREKNQFHAKLAKDAKISSHSCCFVLFVNFVLEKYRNHEINEKHEINPKETLHKKIADSRIGT